MGDDDDDDYGHGGDDDGHGGDRTKGIPGNCHMEMMMFLQEMMRLSAMPSTMGMRSFMKKYQAITIVIGFLEILIGQFRDFDCRDYDCRDFDCRDFDIDPYILV